MVTGRSVELKCDRCATIEKKKRKTTAPVAVGVDHETASVRQLLVPLNASLAPCLVDTPQTNADRLETLQTAMAAFEHASLAIHMTLCKQAGALKRQKTSKAADQAVLID